MENQGVFIAPGTIRFERKLSGSIEKVWSYLTESDKRGKWLAKGEMEMFEGGKVNLHFFHQDLSPIAGSPPEKYKDMASGHSFTGRVLKINPPYLLSFTWEDQSEVTFELEEAGNAVLLILTHRKLSENKDVQVSVAGGWHTHLDILIASLREEIPPNFWSTHARMEELYSTFIN
ncbi:MAG TPA: SRPBCC family protein [Puia sp.]|nr:SRPBCC family protein [Puia sp.]